MVVVFAISLSTKNLIDPDSYDSTAAQ